MYAKKRKYSATFIFYFSRNGIYFSLLIYAQDQLVDIIMKCSLFTGKNCVHDFLILFDSFIIKKWRSQLELLFVIRLRPEVDLFCHQAELIVLKLVTEAFSASFAMRVQ